MEPAVLIGAPIRNMEKTVPLYLEGILGLEYPKKRIALMWILNDSEDTSAQLLQEFKEKHEKKYKRVVITQMDFGAPRDEKLAQVRYAGENLWGTIDSMARGKNVLKDNIEPDEQYLFYVEGDVILKKDCLKKLLAHQRPIVGAMVKTGDMPNCFNILRFDSALDCFTRDSLDIPDVLSLVDFISGPVLFRRDILSEIAFGKMASGEDAMAMRMCAQKNIPVWVDPQITMEHLYAMR